MARSRTYVFVLGVLVTFQLAHAASVPDRFEYLSPKPGARLVSRQSGIIFRPGKSLDRYVFDRGTLFMVEGAVSGAHAGEVVIADDGKTILFKPQIPFEPGERVTVEIDIAEKEESRIVGEETSFDFTVSPKRPDQDAGRPLMSEFEKDRLPTRRASSVYPDGGLAQQDTLLPDDYPLCNVSACDSPDSGYIFLSDFSFGIDPPAANYLMILDDSGTPVFFRKMPDNTKDFKKQPNGLLTYYVDGPFKFYAMDTTYTVVDSFDAGNGYMADTHELRLLPDGHALLLIYDPQPVDMSEIVAGGDTAATVIGLIVQELDESKNVVFEWRSWDHIEITDATHMNFTAHRIDYAHGNAIEVDPDGNLLVSIRHLDEITKIDRQTGEIIWRLGGKNNEFTFINDGGFFRQHHIRRLPNGDITLFDNGTFHTPSYSRAVEYELDEENKIATLVWEYRNAPDIFAAAMGSVQRLPNGNTLIGWGSSHPTITEVRPDGSKAFELSFGPGTYSYRAFRFPWSGVAAAPYLWADTTEQGLKLSYRQFGKNDIEKYYIYQDTHPDPTTIVDSTSANSVVIDSLVEGTTCYFRVASRDSSGNESRLSNQLEFRRDVTEGVDIAEDRTPEEFVLAQNYPNPFNAGTTIRFSLSKDAYIALRVYNMLGQEVRTLVDGRLRRGMHSVRWDGKDDAGMDVGSGIYVCQVRVGEETFSRKMLLLR